ncbi:MAG: alpha/beta fold hydrolase [Myxococcales bacterium]|nr:alpha/beta fold hydrolase [Myxococcales bacterium]
MTLEELDVQAGGVRMRCDAMGTRDGPLVLLLHGFPDCRISWRRQLPALAAAGFRAVAPDLRGYGGSDKPRGVDSYRMKHLVGDVASLIEALGRDRADVVGHDWGGYVAWYVAMWRPERVRRLAQLNIPHPQRVLRRLWTPRQLRKSWYIFFFQLPFFPERFMTDEALRRLYRKIHTPDEIEIIVQSVRDRSPPIHYYRAALRHPSLRWRAIEAPVLVLWGERDRWLGKELAEPDPRWVPNARVERIAEAGHWVHAEAADRVNELLLAFLR